MNTLKIGATSIFAEYSTSAGGQLALAIAELNPKRSDGTPRVHGAVAGCATTPIWTSGVRFDTYAVLKALLDPGNSLLQFLGLPDENAVFVQAWRDVFTAAAEAPQGRARLALAFTLTQWNVWGVGLPRPDPSDIAALENHLREVAVRLHAPHVNTQFLFETQVGVWIGNDGADYRKYWRNGDPRMKKAVRELYRRAGLDVDSEIARVNASPRHPTNWNAADFWLSHSARTQVGKPKMPVFRFHTIGDPQVVVSQVQIYSDQIRKNGRESLYRTAFVERQGHCSFTVAEAAVAVEIMMRRLDAAERQQGKPKHHGDKQQFAHWPKTSPAALNALATSMNTGTESSFIDYHLRAFNGEWRADPPRKRHDRRH